MIAAADRVHLTRASLLAIGAIFFLMGVLAAAYGPLLEHLARRFDVSLAVAGGVLSTHFAGALVGVLVSMRLLQQVASRTFVLGALACLGLGCAIVAVAPSWPAFLGGAFVIGLGYGAAAIGCNQLVAVCTWAFSMAVQRLWPSHSCPSLPGYRAACRSRPKGALRNPFCCSPSS